MLQALLKATEGRGRTTDAHGRRDWQRSRKGSHSIITWNRLEQDQQGYLSD